MSPVPSKPAGAGSTATVAMTQMVVFQFHHAFDSRSLDRSIFRIPLFSNPLLIAGVLLAALSHLSVLYLGPLQRVFWTVPISVEVWGWILLVGTAVTLGGETRHVAKPTACAPDRVSASARK